MAREEEIGNKKLTDLEIEVQRLRRGGLASIEVQTRQTRGIVADIDSVQSDITDLLEDMEILVEALADDVATINFNPDVPADVYWAHPGAEVHPDWLNAATDVDIEIWDATDMRFLARFNDATSHLAGDYRFAWPTGPYGAAHSFEQKIVDATMFILEFRARFTDNSDYTTSGIGLVSASNNAFDNSARDFIQVLRNGSNWELGTCDGSTISQSSVAGADGSLHDFRVEWEMAVVRLYVDDVLAITKATNLPTEPLNFTASLLDGGLEFDLMAIRCRWA